MNKISLCTIALVTTALTGCAARENPALQRAALDVESAARDPLVVSHAPQIVADARRTLELAEREWVEERDRDEVEHLVYLTERQLELAREEARKRAMLESAEAARARFGEQLAGSYRRELGEQRMQIEENQRLVEQLRGQIARLGAQETDRGLELVVASDLLFDFNQDQLKPGAVLQLEPIVEFMRRHPSRSLVVEGHTDNVGDAQYNRELSLRRAEAVRAYFERGGISPERIGVRGMGESFPVASNSSEAGRQHNRRVTLVVSQPTANDHRAAGRRRQQALPEESTRQFPETP